MKRPTRVLAMDHFFDQDLRALDASPRLDIRRFPYQRLRNRALRIMGNQAADGLRGFARPELDPARQRYAGWLRDEVQRMYLERAFDVLVLPSDTFFYVRALPHAAHAVGLPVVVVQKETTLSADTMEEHSRLTREVAPFIADFMTVCSDRQREFWLKAGAQDDVIEVTGQPRFDVYALSRYRPSALRRRVLFLSYELDAYVPGVSQSSAGHIWAPLRHETETVLLEAARHGECEVVVKCHPQQDYRAEKAHLARRAGRQWRRGVSMANEDADTRELILDADVVVGFQTTALFESVAAGRPAVFAAWGAAYEDHRAGLIPFDQAPQRCLRHATSAEQLTAMLVQQPSVPSDPCTGWYEEALGRVDGRATDRVAARLEAVAQEWPLTADREDLELKRRRFAAGLLVRSFAAEAVWTAALPIAMVAGHQRRVATRRGRARDNRSLASEVLRRRAYISRGAG